MVSVSYRVFHRDTSTVTRLVLLQPRSLAQRFITLKALSALLKYLFGGGLRGLNILEDEGSEDLGLILGLSEIGSSSKAESLLKAESSLKTGSLQK